MSDSPSVAIGELWKRRPPGREVVRVERVWQGFDYRDRDAWAIRAHPLKGGRFLVCSPEHLFANYDRLDDPTQQGEPTIQHFHDGRACYVRDHAAQQGEPKP
jgi:hypothetical protein